MKSIYPSKCCLCGKQMNHLFPEERDLGNNPLPLAEDGRCCDDCDMTKVTPARIQEIMWDEKLQ